MENEDIEVIEKLLGKDYCYNCKTFSLIIDSDNDAKCKKCGLFLANIGDDVNPFRISI